MTGTGHLNAGSLKYHASLGFQMVLLVKKVFILNCSSFAYHLNCLNP
jgi:hypothetical protein